jgi:iron complex transport system substrate-binding protein
MARLNMPHFRFSISQGVLRYLVGFLLLIQYASANPQVAKNFWLDSSQGVRWLRVLPTQSKKPFESFALCPNGKCPSGLPKRTVTINIPIRRAICLASAHLGFMSALDLRSRVVGVGQSKYVCDSALRAMGKEGKWKAVGSEDQLDWETVTSLHPDIILYSAPPGSQTKIAAKAKALRLTILPTAEWLENTPLGRAEWLKVYGVLFGVGAKADSLYASTEHAYDSLRSLASLQKYTRIKAMVGLGWRGTWYVSGGRSYAAQFLRDAGIQYLWEEDMHTGSLPLSLESVLEHGRNAEIWVNPEGMGSLSALLVKEPRANKFKAFQTRRVYQSDARRNPEGGNDYWESGVTKPHLILADFIAISNGEIDSLPGHYYRRLPDHQTP